jgi:hypothetical protein
MGAGGMADRLGRRVTNFIAGVLIRAGVARERRDDGRRHAHRRALPRRLRQSASGRSPRRCTSRPVMVGEFVYHCHIVQHADQGMMANIEVVR